MDHANLVPSLVGDIFGPVEWLSLVDGQACDDMLSWNLEAAFHPPTIWSRACRLLLLRLHNYYNYSNYSSKYLSRKMARARPKASLPFKLGSLWESLLKQSLPVALFVRGYWKKGNLVWENQSVVLLTGADGRHWCGRWVDWHPSRDRQHYWK
jgi:hypothetical protein